VSEVRAEGPAQAIGTRLGVTFLNGVTPPPVSEIKASSRLVGRIGVGAELLEVDGVDTCAEINGSRPLLPKRHLSTLAPRRASRESPQFSSRPLLSRIG